MRKFRATLGFSILTAIVCASAATPANAQEPRTGMWAWGVGVEAGAGVVNFLDADTAAATDAGPS